MAKQGNDSTVEVQVAYEPVQRVDSAVIIDETLLK
jgi:sporulation protein YlmC with PRC-barrel domain